MPDIKISDATPAGTLLQTDLVPIARAGTDQPLNATMADLATYVTVLASSHPPAMSNLPETAGVMQQYARADHVHPTDQSRAPIDSPHFTGLPTVPTMPPSDSSDAAASTKFVHDLARSGTLRTDTPAIDDNSELVATTEYVQNQGWTQPPLMDGTPTAGVSQRFARGDHTHPVDVSRYAANNPSGFVDTKGAAAAAPVQSVAGRAGAITLTHADITDWSATLAPYALSSSVPAASSTLPTMDGTAAIGTGTTWARSDHSHASDTSRYAASNPSGFQTAAQVTTIAHAGTATNDSAAAGQIGEFLSAQLLSTSAIVLASGVDAVITSLPLTPGDWDVWGSVGFTMVSNNNTVLKAWLNAGGTTAPSIDQMGGNVMNTINNNTPQAIVPVPPMRVSTASAITMALGSSSTTAGGTINGWGKIMARRRR